MNINSNKLMLKYKINLIFSFFFKNLACFIILYFILLYLKLKIASFDKAKKFKGIFNIV